MPIHVPKVKKDHSEVSVQFNEESAKVTYNKTALSNKEWREIRKRAANGKEPEADDDFNLQMLSRLLVSWDVLEEEGGKAYPINKKSLDELPWQFLNAVVTAIVEDLFPNPTTAPESGSFG